MKIIFAALIFCSLIITSCEDKYDRMKKETSEKVFDSTLNIIDTSDYHTQIFSFKDFLFENGNLDKRVDEIFSRMTDDERIAQMIVTSTGSLGKPESYVAELISKKKVGGVLLLGGSKESFTRMIKSFSQIADTVGSLPLIFSTDAEPSLINDKIYGVKKFNPTNTIKTSEESESIAKDISEIIKGIGFNQNYAPVCDFPYNREIIGDRSFGKNENELTILAESFIKETQENGVIATAKHFPGHGNVNGDSHKEIVYINGELKEVNVFKKMIEAGVYSVMVGHIAIENNKRYDTEGLPSTLSRKIVTHLLKNELGFKGIVITDAMNMEAVTKFQSPSLKAIEAGCDMVLMPSDETRLINSVKEKMNVDSGFREQVYESVRRVVRMKVVISNYNDKK